MSTHSFMRKLLVPQNDGGGGPEQAHMHTMGDNMAYTSGPLSAFNTKIIIVTACLLLVLIFALVANILTRWFLRRLLSSPSTTPSSYAHASLIGLKKDHLNSLPTTTYNASQNAAPLANNNNYAEFDAQSCSQCPICLVEFRDGERIRVLPKCEHGFHVPCIDPWLMKHASCPTCRGDLMESIIKTPST